MAFRNRNRRLPEPPEAPVPGGSCQELNFLIARLKARIEYAKEDYQKKLEQDALAAANPTSPFLGRFLRRQATEKPETIEKGSIEFSQFIEDPDGMVEDLRRISELAVIGENLVSALAKKREGLHGTWKKNDELQDYSLLEKEVEEASRDERLQLFDIFFESKVLEMVVNLLTGQALSLDPPKKKANDAESRVGELSGDDTEDDVSRDSPRRMSRQDSTDDAIVLLPSIKIATQAIQSICILIQNVSRATSLYVILSNNHINSLVNLDLDKYETAERARQKSMTKDGELTFTFKSPELGEFTTHFIAFLKSLALRMNGETLQFYLTYPTEVKGGSVTTASHFEKDEESPDDEEGSMAENSGQPTTYTVEFPLYDRALDFCAAHHDSFVRVTALNICLNTLRLTTVIGGQDSLTMDKDEPKVLTGDRNAQREKKSPTGVLHSIVLPFRERLAIAQHACSPTRVEKLVAPMFSKLAERWNAMQEAIKEIDAHSARGETDSTKVGIAKEKVKKQRLLRGFREQSDNFQDEILLLEDVFKVGLTVLNEQVIEMMLATFVYPLLLQPLLLYYQRFDSTVDRSQSSDDRHPFNGFGGDFSHADSALAVVASPAKTALFTLASVFHSCTNKPLLRLLYTALFHPLSPDSNSVPTVRSKLEVAASARNGEWFIRVDPVEVEEEDKDYLIPNIRSTYPFGTNLLNRRCSRSNMSALEQLEGTEACVFVLAPALAEILEFRGEDLALITRTRPNPYRRALLQCLDVPYEMDEMRQLAVCTYDAALSIFDGQFASQILFGKDIKTYTDDIPLDERNLDSSNAYEIDDRGIGGSARNESRMSLGRQSGKTKWADLTGEVVSALCGATIFAVKDEFGGFHLGYDDVAAHALLVSIHKDARAMLQVAKITDARWRRAAAFLAQRAIDLHNTTGGGSTFLLDGSPSPQAPDFEEVVLGGILDAIFYQSASSTSLPVVEEFKEIQADPQTDRSACSTCMTTRSTLRDMRERVGSRLNSEAKDLQYDRRQLYGCQNSAKALAKMSCLSSFLQDLAATGGLALYDCRLQGVAVGLFGKIIDISEAAVGNQNREIYGPLAPDMSSTLFSDGNTALPDVGTLVPMVGHVALACVCEVHPSFAHLFSSNGVVVAEGVTWQSLYLVLAENCLLLVQSQPEQSGSGKVISASLLERVSARAADDPDTTSPARRLILAHQWFSMETPPLFMFDEMPQWHNCGPLLVDIKPFVCTVDVWFENERSADYALRVFTQKAFTARSRRGRRMFDFLTPGESIAPQQQD